MASGQGLVGKPRPRSTHSPTPGSPPPLHATHLTPGVLWFQSEGWGLADGWKGEPGKGPPSLGKKLWKEEG